MIKSDGNGGVTIPKWAMIIIPLLIAIITIVASTVAYGVTIKNDVETLKQEWREAEPVHTAIINNIETRLDTCEISQATTKTLLSQIQEDIREIKTDVKEIKNELSK